jgi:hypothetical protein
MAVPINIGGRGTGPACGGRAAADSASDEIRLDSDGPTTSVQPGDGIQGCLLAVW